MAGINDRKIRTAGVRERHVTCLTWGEGPTTLEEGVFGPGSKGIH